ncbi:MAG: hypothetical protein ACT4P1_06740 [Sporichthyaceae bacterium]
MSTSDDRGAAATWRRFHDPFNRFSLPIPPGWEIHGEPRVTLPVLMTAPDDGGGEGPQANILVTVSELPAAMTFRDWQLGTDQLLGQTLDEYLLLDLEHVSLGGHPGVRRLGCHNAGGRAVTMEQWAAAVGTRGLAVTATVSTGVYDAFADDLSAIAAGLHIPEAASVA